MKEKTDIKKPVYSLLPSDLDGVDLLAELALDMRWSWNHAADEVWRLLDPALWDLTHNPWVVLQTVSRDQFQSVMNDPAFRKKIDALLKFKKDSNAAPAWFQQHYPQSPLTSVAYFSMEFMLSEALPIYSGGLGNVAGDQLKTASDLGVPVGYITNGVHMPSWDSKESDDIWTESCGKDRWLGTMENLGQNIRKINDERLWQMRTNSRASLIQYARERLSRQLVASGASSGEAEYVKKLFDPNTLTLGFARRFATYKRPDLLLHDPQRLIRLLSDPQHPVQLIIAGKAHPADQAGQDLITKWINFIRQSEVRPHVIFLSDYDMLLTERLVEGVDVWINTPRRPWEAKSMSQLTPRFSANRTVREYTEKYYLPLAKTYKARAADKGKTGRQIVEWINAFKSGAHFNLER